MDGAGVIFKNIYVYADTSIHVIKTNERRDHKFLKMIREGNMGSFGGKKEEGEIWL